jgi:hypothetical protein
MEMPGESGGGRERCLKMGISFREREGEGKKERCQNS